MYSFVLNECYIEGAAVLIYGPGFRFHFLFSCYVYVGLIMKKLVGFCEILSGFGEGKYLNIKKSCYQWLLGPVPSSSGPPNIYGSRDR